MMTDGARRWQGIVREWERSGQSQTEFCRLRGINGGTFSWWKRQLEAQRPAVLPQSPMAEAIGYCLNRWAAMERYVLDGRPAIDNNAAENALRPIVLGRKNWLFAGSDNGGRTGAVLAA